MKCNKCGHPLPEEAKFCPECGTPVEQEENESVVQEEMTEKLPENPASMETAEVEKEEVVHSQEENSQEEDLKEEIPAEEKTSEEEVLIWYYVKGSESVGPLSVEAMRELIEKKEIRVDTLVWKSGMADWQKLSDTELKDILPTPETQSEDQWYYVNASNKQEGPYTQSQMQSFIDAGLVFGNTFVWKAGMDDWKRLKETELASMLHEKTTQEAPSFSSQKHTKNEPVFITSRSVGMGILLTIVTCGIYYWYWLYCVAKDINQCARSQHREGPGEPGLVVLLSIVTCGLYGIYFYWKAGKVLSELEFDNGFRLSDNSIIMLVLPILGFSIISMAICQSSLNDIERYANR